MEKTLEFRGIHQETMIKYLSSITQLTDNHIITNNDQSVIIKSLDWSVTVSDERVYHASSIISFPQLFLTFTGEKEAVEEAIRQLRTKTLRLGG